MTDILLSVCAVRALQEAEKARLEEERKKRQEVLDAQLKKQREREEEIEAKMRRQNEAMEERREKQRNEAVERKAPAEQQGSWRHESEQNW